MAGATATELSFSSRMIGRETVEKAVDSLLKWMRARAERQQKAQLLDPDDDLLYIVLTLKRIPPKSRINPYRIPLPYPLHDLASTSACLFLDDRDRSGRRRSSSSLTTAAATLDRARSLSLPLADAIPLSALAADYRPFEARRRLCDSHDLFFADRAVLPLLPRLIGKHFFKKKKLPLALDLSRSGWPEQLRGCLQSTLFHLRAGSCSVLKVGRLSMARDQIVDNVMAAIEGAMAHVPKKWANVRSLHVKALNSVALPMYQAVPERGLKIEVPAPRMPQKKDEMEEDAEEAIGEGEVVQEEEKPELEEDMPRKGRRIHEVPYIDTANDPDLGYEEFLNGESEDKGIMEEEEEGEAMMEETMNKEKTKKNKTNVGVEVKDGKQKEEEKREDNNKNDREEVGNGRGNGESRVAVAKKKGLKKEGKVKKENDKKCRKVISAVDSVIDGNYNAGKDGDVDILSADDEEGKGGGGKKMKKSKKDDNMKKEKGKRSKDGVCEDDRGHEAGGAEESYNRMTTEKKVMKVTKENAKVNKGMDGMTNKKSKTNRLEDKELKKIKRSKLRHKTD